MSKSKRRQFLKTVGASVSLAGLPTITWATHKQPQGSNRRLVTSAEQLELGNGVRLELLSQDTVFKGLGEVTIGSHTIRNGALPMFCEIRNPEGISVSTFHLKDKKVSAEEVVLRFGVQIQQRGMMEYMLHTVRNRENLYSDTDEPVSDAGTEIEMILRPVSRTMGAYAFTGFSYQYKFKSQSFPVYKITDRATWNIDGRAVGNTCWMRIGHVPSIVPITDISQHYSTENYYKGIANPNVFQFLPLQTELQGFTFQTHKAGVLVTWPTEVAHVRTIIEKPRGRDEIFHFHQHCGDLTYAFATSPVEVLWLAKPLSEPEQFNVYEFVRETIHRQLHEKAGIKPEGVATYGMIEEWTEPDFDDYTDNILPKLIEKGIKRIFLPNEFENAMNTWGLSNMCCNVDYKFSETIGVEKIKRFCRKAKEAGITVDMWGNTALSTLTEMFQWRDGREKGIKFLPRENSVMEMLKKSKDPFVRNPSNAIEADHYAPRFAALNLRDKEVIDYWMKSWKVAYDTGISGIFLDSSFNMSSDKFHFIQNTTQDTEQERKASDKFYRPTRQPAAAILSQYSAHLQLIREMQQMGYSYCGEDLGVFGIHRHGPDLSMIIDSLPIWRDCLINFDENYAKSRGFDPMDIFFRGLAYRVMWMLRWDFERKELDLGTENTEAYTLLKAFNIVNHIMEQRLIVHEGKGVLYKSGAWQVLWAFEPLEHKLKSRMRVTEVISGKVLQTKNLQAGKRKVYLFDGI